MIKKIHLFQSNSDSSHTLNIITGQVLPHACFCLTVSVNKSIFGSTDNFFFWRISAIDLMYALYSTSQHSRRNEYYIFTYMKGRIWRRFIEYIRDFVDAKESRYHCIVAVVFGSLIFQWKRLYMKSSLLLKNPISLQVLIAVNILPNLFAFNDYIHNVFFLKHGNYQKFQFNGWWNAFKFEYVRYLLAFRGRVWVY